MRLNDGRVIPAFIGQALRGEDLTVFGDGSQTRSFCYINDQVEGIYRLLHSDYPYPVNIGNPDEITIKDFAEEIIRLTGTTQKIVYHALLDWEPTVSRSEGMELTYKYFCSLSEEELQMEEHKDFSEFIH
jgi:dTDP-glucose 4,6-dehydratase